MITMRQIWIKKDQTLRRDEIISGDGVRSMMTVSTVIVKAYLLYAISIAKFGLCVENCIY